MIFYYLDASAWVKRYYQEEGTVYVQNLFTGNQTIACASLDMIEVMATLSRKYKAHEITISQFKKKAQELENDWSGFIQIQMTSETVDMAKELAKKLALRGSDAVHLSSALLLQRRFTEKKDRLIVVASDYELKEAAKSSGLLIIDPIEQITE